MEALKASLGSERASDTHYYCESKLFCSPPPSALPMPKWVSASHSESEAAITPNDDAASDLTSESSEDGTGSEASFSDGGDGALVRKINFKGGEVVGEQLPSYAEAVRAMTA